jgi:CRISPR-associated Cas5-like protein
MTESHQVLRATLDVPHETAFFKSDAMNGLPTYPVPPIPTLQGLLYAAMGRPSLLQPTQLSNDVRNQEEEFRERVQNECQFGQRIIDEGYRTQSLRSRHKATRSSTDEAYVSYPTQAETIIAPTYRFYVTGPTELLDKFAESLRNPKRLLYLGRSDDMVSIRNVNTLQAELVDEGATLDCVIPGAGKEPVLLPVQPDYRDGRSNHPAQVRTVSVFGGEVDEYYQAEDGDKFVYIT